jgi:hypothetical protein
MIVWGGFKSGNPVATGASYDLAKDAWTAMPLANALPARFGHSATWAFDRMIVWGGNDTFDWHSDGAVFVPTLGASGAWAAFTSNAGAPSLREAHSAVWTGSRVLLWGGWNGGTYFDDGATFDPSSSLAGVWDAMSTAGAPTPRRDHRAVWTGHQMVVWGGCGDQACATLYADGGRYVPDFAGGAWRPIPATSALTARKGFSMVWTGTEVLLWGGDDGDRLGDGVRGTP